MVSIARINSRLFPAKIVFITLFAFSFYSSLQAANNHLFVHSNLPHDVKTASRLDRLSSSRVLHLTVSLPGRDLDEMNSLLQAVYDRHNARYHHYLTPDQFTSQFGPTQEDYQKLIGFLKSDGLRVDKAYTNRVCVSVTGTVNQIENTFNVHLHNYQRPDGTQFYAPDKEPSTSLEIPIEHVSGLDNAHPAKPASPPRVIPKADGLNGTGNGGYYWGGDFRKIYASGVASTGAGQTIAIFSMQTYAASDIATYCSDSGIALDAAQNVTCGVFTNTGGTAEMTLDMEMVNSMAPGADIVAYIGNDTDTILSQIASDDTANQVTASYSLPMDNTVLFLLIQMALQGQSFLNSSGDGDAYLNGTTSASSTAPQDLSGSTIEQPWVTVVGGTALSTNSGPVYSSETVWNGVPGAGKGSGGGFSTSIPIPGYQSTVPMTTNNGSTSFRDIPDVSCVAANIIGIQGGVLVDYYGTSAATPLWAGFIALANEQAVAASKPPLGFLNPLIYEIGQSANYSADFHDVTSGNNDATGSHPTEYSAVAGYDLATGWGSMAGQPLINDLIADYVPTTATITPSPTSTPSGCSGVPGANWTTQEFEDLGAQGGGAFNINDGNGPEPVVIGASNSGVTVLYSLTSGVWGTTQAFAQPVTGRTNYDLVSFNGWIWVIGGLSGAAYMNDVWRTANGSVYASVNNSAGFPGRDNFGLLTYNNKLWVIGGQVSTGAVTNDVWSSPDGKTWTQATASAAFSARQLHSVVVFNNRMWVLGGKNSAGALLNDVWSSTDGITWTLSTGSLLNAVDSALATVCGDTIWLIGGTTGTGSAGTVQISEDGINWSNSTNSAPFGSALQYSSSAFPYNGNVWVVGPNGSYTSSCCSLPTLTPTITATNTATQTATHTATNTSTRTPTATGTNSPTQTATNTGTHTSTNTSTSTPTNTPTTTDTQTATNTPTLTPVITSTFTNTATNTSSSTATNTPSDTSTQTATNTATNTITGTIPSTDTATNTSTNTPSSTVTNTATSTATSTATNTPTSTASNSATQTATNTATPTSTNTTTNTPTVTTSSTATNSATTTSTNSATQTATNTATITSTASKTNTATSTATNTPTATATNTFTPQSTSTLTSTPTVTPTSTPTLSAGIVISEPFPNPSTGSPISINVSLPGQSTVTLDVFTLAFRKISSQTFQAYGYQTFQWNLKDLSGTQVSNGLYYVRIQVTGSQSATKILKMLVLR